MVCEMCGAHGTLFRAKVEDIEMHICENCSKFGTVLAPVREPQKEIKKIAPKAKQETLIERIVEDFAVKIRKKREELGIDQDQFAKRINQKKSIVHKLENREFTPSIALARILEKKLGLTLVEEWSDEKPALTGKISSEEVTIGDLIKIKKRK